MSPWHAHGKLDLCHVNIIFLSSDIVLVFCQPVAAGNVNVLFLKFKIKNTVTIYI
jgi:hypothetical protein